MQSKMSTGLWILVMVLTLGMYSQVEASKAFFDGEGDSGTTATDKLTSDGQMSPTFVGDVSVVASNAAFGDKSFLFGPLGGRIELPGTTALGGSYTLAMMIKMDPEIENSSCRFFSNYEGGPVVDSILFGKYSYWGLQLEVGSAVSNIGFMMAPNTGVYHHVALTYDQGTFRTYVDGALKTEHAVTDPVQRAWIEGAMTRNVCVGADSNGGESLKGNVDDILVFDRALSQTEIANIYQQGASILLPDVPRQALFDGEGDSGTTATDKLTSDGQMNPTFVGDVSVVAANAAFGDKSFLFGPLGGRIELPGTTALGGSYTLAMMIKMDPEIENSSCRFFSSYAGGGPVESDILFGKYSYWGLQLDVGSAVSSMGFLMAPGTGAYHHVALTYDQGTFRTYVDGALKTENTVTDPAQKAWIEGAMTRNVFVGADSNGMEPLKGNVDDILVLDRALAQAEIIDVYQHGADALLPGSLTFSPEGGVLNGAQNVVITCANPSAVIRYTIDGNDPTTASDEYPAGGVLVDHSLTLKAAAWIDGVPGNVKSADYVVTAKTPTFSPGFSIISAPRDITISCDTAGAVIRYTTDGNDPTESSAIYSAPISVGNGTTLKACAFKAGLEPSSIKSATYSIPATYNRPETISYSNSITVDGNLSDWADATWTPLDKNYDGNPTDIANAVYAAKWGDNGKLYVAIKVQETSAATYDLTNDWVAWDGNDQVEIYVHSNSTVAGNIMLQDAAQQYTIGVKNDSRDQVWARLISGQAVPANADFQAAGNANASGLITYEVALTTFEYFGGLTVPSQPNIISPLSAGDVVGLDICPVGSTSSGYTGMKAENLVGGKYADWTLIGLHKVAAPVTQIPGDANNDGMVDVGDLGILAANYGGSGKTWAQGDFNNDGLVDVGDLGILAANYGTGVNGSVDFSADYAKAFGTAAEEEAVDSNSLCSGLGLPLIAGLLLAGLMLVKLEE